MNYYDSYDLILIKRPIQTLPTLPTNGCIYIILVVLVSDGLEVSSDLILVYDAPIIGIVQSSLP